MALVRVGRPRALLGFLVLLVLFVTASVVEKERQALLLGLGMALMVILALYRVMRQKMLGRYENPRSQRRIKVSLALVALFLVSLLLPTERFFPHGSARVGVVGEQKAYDARKQPGSAVAKKINNAIASDVLTLTIYDICVGKVSHRVRRDGPVNPVPVDIVDAAALTAKIKDDARALGAHVVGVTRLKPQYVFSHDLDGEPINIDHKYAIVVGVGMKYRLANPSAPLPWQDYYSALPEDLASALSGAMVKSDTKIPPEMVQEVRETMEFFHEGGSIAVQLAAYIRSLGYRARAHLHNRAGEVQIIPLAVEAGLGELGKNGILINREFGPRGSFCVVTTDLPLVTDKPAPFGVREFCGICNKCARSCPVQAIPYGAPHEVNGVVKWPLDGEKCFDFLVSHPKCLACMGSCPYNKQDFFVHRLATWLVARRSIVTDYLMVKLDDFLGYGKQAMAFTKAVGAKAAAAPPQGRLQEPAK